ncbi:MAG TPA: diadenylate cyclase CdaA [Candidatus Wallbacteria bacterium]|nr:MAG: DisA bacterial checkpoint controller nucleotide-binding protein [bacterium ADurb.Bin243]HOD42339.1 diadenylate cyclase CdaA [Candidatus Wallbacteria bacterium]HPG58861.1 diadenylate cyclase CdaA [Candidatus Wallbacteria bacterium]
MLIYLLSDIRIFDIIDILIVSFIIYEFILLIKGTRAMQILLGLVFVLLPLIISPWIQLNTIIWMLERILPIGFIAILILFQPEFRKTLEKLGRRGFFSGQVYLKDEELEKVIGEIQKAALTLSKDKIGAIMVIARETALEDYLESGTLIKGIVSAELLQNIFYPKSPLHDGAVIISNGFIDAAGCILPLTDNPKLQQELGTRHRAAIGITETSDAVSVIVSEETGIISIAANGIINRKLDGEELSRNLRRMLSPLQNKHLFKARI